MNTFGRIFRLTDFGESHGPAMGGIIDGVPAGFNLNTDYVKQKINMRRPGQAFTSPRKETDNVEWLSGIADDGRTLGTPIGFLIRNHDYRNNDYEQLQHTFRPGHADLTTLIKYGLREYRGGGRASARQTICRVVAGAVAGQMLKSSGIELRSFVSGIGEVQMPEPYAIFPSSESIEQSNVYCPDKEIGTRMEKLLLNNIGKDSIGGRVSLIVRGMPVGIGSPVYHRLNAILSKAMMSINAARGVEFGLGMQSATMCGSTAIDEYISAEGAYDTLRIHTRNNYAGGMEGGISNGEDITLSVAFKPTPTRPYKVHSFCTDGTDTEINLQGRHDPCVAIRAVPVVEAMAAMVLLDEILANRTTQWH